PLRSGQARHRFWFRALICLSITVAVAFPVVFRNLIATMLPIANGSVTYSTWESPSDSTPIYMQFWLFNLTNVEQIGPFTYEEQRNKGNITAYSNSTIAYKEYRSFHFRPDLSCCPEETELSIANLAYFTLTNMLRYSSSVLQLLADDLFKSTHNPPVMHRSINPTIGLFYGKNGSDDGEYLIFTGQSDVGHLALVDRWQFNTSLSNWDSKSSNMLNGTDGTMFPPFVDPKKRLYIYSTDICRSIYVTYAGPTSVRGIDLLRFTAPAEVFYNSTLNPENQGFCVGGICLDSGVLNLTTCQPGVSHVKVMKPVFMPIMWVNESATIGSDSADQFRGSVLLAVKAAAAVQWGSLAVGLVCFLACLSACACQRARRNRQNFNSDTRPDINDTSSCFANQEISNPDINLIRHYTAYVGGTAAAAAINVRPLFIGLKSWPISGSSASSTIKWRVASGLLGVGAVLCLAAGLALPHLARGMFSDKLAKLLPISADSPTYSSWVSSELRKGAKPSLEQWWARFTFAETRTRDGVKF
uniref:Protein kinase domain-containing protein n=1 Tax=Macrostomum lignano TaxID=282301 RepID=A0A1I8FPS6_9PLAT